MPNLDTRLVRWVVGTVIATATLTRRNPAAHRIGVKTSKSPASPAEAAMRSSIRRALRSDDQLPADSNRRSAGGDRRCDPLRALLGAGVPAAELGLARDPAARGVSRMGAVSNKLLSARMFKAMISAGAEKDVAEDAAADVGGRAPRRRPGAHEPREPDHRDASAGDRADRADPGCLREGAKSYAKVKHVLPPKPPVGGGRYVGGLQRLPATRRRRTASPSTADAVHAGT